MARGAFVRETIRPNARADFAPVPTGADWAIEFGNESINTRGNRRLRSRRRERKKEKKNKKRNKEQRGAGGGYKEEKEGK